MKIIDIELIAQEPLVITDGSAEGMAHTSLDYIPGGKLLGAFATIWIRDHPDLNPDATPEFQNLFLNGQVSWGCAYPLCESKKCVPVPACFMREKSAGGLPLAGKAAPENDFAIFNTLPLKEGEKLSDLWKKRVDDPEARSKFKKLAATFMQPDIMREPIVHKVWNTRVALGKQRAALKSQLFGFAAIAPGTAFSAEIFCENDEVFAILRKLLAENDSVRLGHTRSAGYGKTAVKIRGYEEGDAAGDEAKTLDIFLLSDYLPMPAWENPLENFALNLEMKLSQKLTLSAWHVTYGQLESYNSHWRSWRDSRPVIKAGSVFRFSRDASGPVPQKFVLGADRLEGYGRALVNPPFLKDVEPLIPVEASKKNSPLPQPPFGVENLAVWKVLKRKTLDSLARDQALDWLQTPAWREFLASAARLKYPTASQRANLLAMKLDDFKSTLKKSAATQWTTQVCRNPFDGGGQYLDKIIGTLLDRKEFLLHFPVKKELPWKNGEDQEELTRLAHELFRRELTRAWGKDARIRRQTRSENGK